MSVRGNTTADDPFEALRRALAMGIVVFGLPPPRIECETVVEVDSSLIATIRVTTFTYQGTD